MEYLGSVVTIALITFGLLSKALLETLYFKDVKAAKTTVKIWLLMGSGALGAFSLTLLFNYLS